MIIGSLLSLFLMMPQGVKPMNADAYKAICNTLTAADKPFVVLDATGMIDVKLMNSRLSESDNFNALKAMVNDNRITEVFVANDYQYRGNDGEVRTGRIGVKYFNELDHAVKYMIGYTRDQLKAMGFEDKLKRHGTYGITLFPDGENDVHGDGKGSLNGNITVILSSDLTARDAARTQAHEGNGHVLFFLLGKDPNHSERKAQGGNRELEDQITRCVLEAERSYDALHNK